jgi:hypothetical protein
MDTRNVPRDATETNKKDGDFEYYLKSGMPSNQIVSILKAQKKDQREIDAFMAKYETSKKRISKLIRKFVDKIEQQFGHLDVPELIKKGVKFAAKHNFTEAEKEAFIRFVLKGDTDSQYLPFQELSYTEMSKFLGFSSFGGQVLDVKATDQNTLNEIVKKYGETRFLHTSLKNQMLTYRDCAVEALVGQYDSDKHNVALHIHPVVAALFLPKVEYLERRMLLTNIGRMVAQRAQPYIRTNIPIADQYLHGELNADLELAYDIASDPNSMAYFSDEQPINNLYKRYLIQIKLWQNVLNLRQGRYYASNYRDDEDTIVGLQKTLNSYDWTYFDSPDLTQVQDEGTILRKLLAVFSIRPTFTQISSVLSKNALGYSNLGNMARTTFVNTPIVNLKLRTHVDGTSMGSVNLRAALTQSDWFIENKMLVPKHKAVIYSREVMFFYANRKYQAVNFAALNDTSFNYVQVPAAYNGITKINTTELNCDESINVGNEIFDLKSVVVVNKPLVEDLVSIGCSAIIKCEFSDVTHYIHYNPQTANIPRINEDGIKNAPFNPNSKLDLGRSAPVSLVPKYSTDEDKPNFNDMAKKYGTIYMYVRRTA